MILKTCFKIFPKCSHRICANFAISEAIMAGTYSLNPFLKALLRGGTRGRVQGVRNPPEMACGFLIQLVFCKKKKTMWFIGVEVEQETSAPPPKKNPGSAPDVEPKS